MSPIVSFYATGYRLGDKFELMKTGGIYVVTGGKDFNVFVDGVEQTSSSIFRRNFLVQDIRPKIYNVKVEKEGFVTWSKDVNVYPEKVNELYPFNLPEEIVLTEIPKQVYPEGVATTTKTKKVDNKEFVYVKNLFLATSTKSLINEKVSTGTSTEDKNLAIHKKVVLEVSSDEILAKWFGDIDVAPLYFCDLNKCVNEITVYKGEEIKKAELFFGRDDLVIFSTKNGIYLTEIDGKGGRNTQTLAKGNYDFKIDKEGIIYLKKDKDVFYLIDLKD